MKVTQQLASCAAQQSSMGSMLAARARAVTRASASMILRENHRSTRARSAYAISTREHVRRGEGFVARKSCA